MARFKDADHFYRVLDPFFARLTSQPQIARALVAGRFVLRFRYSDPEAQVTFDLRREPITWTFGDSELEPDLELIQSADTAHEFWLGRLNVARALATRQVVSRGAVSRALKLLPAIKPAFPLYAEVLREQGHHELLPADPGAPPPLLRLRRRLAAAAGQLSRSLSARLGRAPAVDFEALAVRPVPTRDGPAPRIPRREQPLPAEREALLRQMLARMELIRAFEQALSGAYARGEVPTEAIHLSIGQEAVAVGACFALRVDDLIATTHRGHGHMLAKGADLDGMMAELAGKATGLCGGKGGSMHVTDAAVGAIGANGIVGASALLVAGAAHAIRLRGGDQVALAFMGDGATNQGMFHEALNFAAVLRLPALFVVENNLYGEFTPLSRHLRVERIAERAAAYGMPGETVDGNDPWEVHEAVTRAAARARAGDGPTLLECLTYRWHGHMEGEAVDYRSAEEIARWKERCPIRGLRERLVQEGVLTEQQADEAGAEARQRVERAVQLAGEAPAPGRDALTTEVFAPDPPELYRPSTAPGSAGREITYSRALFEALAEELARDERTYLLGEDVTTGGYFAVTVGLSERFGGGRIVDTPISEYAIVGSAVGAALTGMRPVAEILFSDFLTTCMDPIVNQAAKLRYMSGGQYSVPLVVRTPGGAGLGMAAQHSQSLEALLTGIPGLMIVAPSTPHDAKGLLKAAIRSDNPVLVFENKLLYPTTGPVPDEGEEVLVPLGVADVKRPGRDATVVALGAATGKALEAARALEAEGIDAEVVDLRTLVPLDVATIVRSVVHTGRLVTVEDAPLTHGFGAEIVSRVAEAAFGALRAAPKRVAALDVPIPYNSELENAALPDVASINRAVQEVVRG